MSHSSATAAAVRELVLAGEAINPAMAQLGHTPPLGLWSFDATTGSVVGTGALVRLAARLPNVDEAVTAVFACDPAIRQAWLRIAGARLREAGKRRDTAELCRAIGELGAASRRIREGLSGASLQPTGHQALELELFGSPAEQAVAAPKLLRALAATAELVEGGRGAPTRPLPPLEPLAPARAWCAGRLIRLPDVTAPAPDGLTAVVTGSCQLLTPSERVATDDAETARMRWVLCRPWAMFLAQVVFTQEAWEAEQIAGGVALELADDQLAHAYEPARVDVVVATPDGEEVLCGTLGQWLRRVMARLDISLVARPDEAAALDERLAAVVRLMLEKKIWRPHTRAKARPKRRK